jgi:AcrR family transcriptional regulator
MVNLSRKEREYLEREQRILEIARPMVVREGYHALNMNRIADELEYSKGTVYNHFPCKEEIILALAIQTLQQQTSMFQRGAKFVGRSRERMQAIGVACELFARLHPEHFLFEQLVRIPSIWEKTSSPRQQQLYRAETCCLTLVAGIVHEAVGAGDLVLPVGLTAEELVFGLWSMTFGAYSMLATNSNLPALGVINGYDAVRAHLRHMLDGYHWRPLDAELDYDLVVQRVLEQHFPEELAHITAVASSPPGEFGREQ